MICQGPSLNGKARLLFMLQDCVIAFTVVQQRQFYALVHFEANHQDISIVTNDIFVNIQKINANNMQPVSLLLKPSDQPGVIC